MAIKKQHIADAAGTGGIQLVREQPMDHPIGECRDGGPGEVLAAWFRAQMKVAEHERLALCSLPSYLVVPFRTWLRGHRQDIVACSHNATDVSGTTLVESTTVVKLPNGDYAASSPYVHARVYYVRICQDKVDWSDLCAKALEFTISCLETLPAYRPEVCHKSALDGLVLPDGLLEDIVADSRQFLAGSDQYDALKLPWKRGYMFIGPPGNGKTYMARALAEYWGLAIVDLSSCVRSDGSVNLGTSLDEMRAHLLSRVSGKLTDNLDVFGRHNSDNDDDDGKEAVISNFAADMLDGQTVIGRNLRDRVSQLLSAHPAPTVYVLEDIDKFVVFQAGANKRHQDAGEVPLHMLLKALDGVHSVSSAIIIATTNYSNELSEALINRPGRFDRIWQFPLPTQEALVKYLAMHGMTCTGMSLEEVAAGLDGLSMAFAEELVKSLRMMHRRLEFSKEEVIGVLSRIKKHHELVGANFEKPIRGFAGTDK